MSTIPLNLHACYRPTPTHAAALLSQRFDRDKRIDWKQEYVRRQASIQTVKQAYDEAVAALEEARAAVQEAEAKVQESKESRVEDEDTAAEDDAPALGQVRTAAHQILPCASLTLFFLSGTATLNRLLVGTCSLHG